MPRNLKPDALKTGSGKRVPEKGTTVVLGGTGMSGPGPNIGQANWMDPATGQQDLPNWLKNRLNSAGAGAIDAHLQQVKGAHEAGAISIKDQNQVLQGMDGDNVQEVLHTLHGTMPIEPPHIGEWRGNLVLSGIPDWGILKVEDRDLISQGVFIGFAGNAPVEDVYPYFYKEPSPLIGPTELTNGPFNDHGGDPQTDTEWNSGLDNSVMWGTGPGILKVGGFTRDGSATNQDVMRTAGILQQLTDIDDVTGYVLRREVTLSGVVYPADRGVLALIHWPAGTTNNGPPDVDDFMAQDLLDRCVAALLLGQGLYGEECLEECDDPVCDGDLGGIFAVGEVGEQYDPFVFPGRASGQYDLDELHNGVNRLDGTDLQEPFAGGTPNRRAFYGEVPAPGQVRLGTDPTAGEADPTGFGIPILGGTRYAYDTASPPADRANVHGASGRVGHIVIGNSIIQMEDPAAPGIAWLDTNFFRYRLPYLKDYDGGTGLKWTPTGDDPTLTRERWRFLENSVPNSSSQPYLSTAGNYGTPYTEDQITWQIARYRHSFLLPSNSDPGEVEELGSYWLIHFKKERDFEAFVRDGVMPWDATDGYDIFGASIFDTADFEDDGNVANEVLNASGWAAPLGPAPNYTYVSDTYFSRRNTLVQTPTHSAFTATGTFDWTMRDPSNSFMHVSGVAYLLPRRWEGGSAGDANIEISDISITEGTSVFFEHGYRTADFKASGELTAPVPANVDPALVSSPNPAFITFFPFAYDEHPSPPVDAPDSPSATFPLNDDTGISLSMNNTPRMPSRVEIPFTHMGPAFPNDYNDTNGPQFGDSFTIGLAGGANITLEGDDLYPSFTMRARPRCFFRRPLNHRAATSASEPYSATDGHGIIVEPSDDAEILLHTTRFDKTNLVGRFGNFYNAGPLPVPGYSSQYTSEKDTHERFLDETYRYIGTFARGAGDPSGVASIAGVGALGLAHLQGPGMAGYAGGPIEVPVRAGLTPNHSINWAYSAFLPLNLTDVDMNNFGAGGYDLMGGELQVVGWPDRNPPLSDRVNAPYPSTGLLIYPRRDYSTVGSPNIRPSGPLGAGDLPGEQPDYSTLTGLREYVRCFDASFGGSVAAAGQPFVTIRLDGVNLSQIAYSAPGPGSLNRADANANTFLAVLIKVPGLTTWMDVGRADGGGPSKQDNLLDGAGCQVVGTETFDDVDEDSGITYCQIKCNVGPAVNLFASTGIEGTTVGEVPVLVKVVMLDTAKALDMAHDFDTLNFTGPVAGAGTSYTRLRGLCGIRVVDTTTT